MAIKSYILVQLLAFLFFNIKHFTHSTQCIKTEREALLKLKSGLEDPGNRLSSWVGDNCCSWVGVRCRNRTGHVVRLDLSCDPYCPMPLSGALSPSLLALQHLKHLHLAGNNFTRTSVPEFIGSFKVLTYLNLSRGGFEGTVPRQLGNISSLRYLDLSWNHLSEDTDGNVRWWHELAKLPSLVSLNLQFCGLNSLPRAVPYTYFKSLSFLDLSWNFFNTTIPDWLFNITSLKTLQLTGNQFKGSIPSSVGRLASLNVLHLGGNMMTGPLPKELGHLCNLQSLRLCNNHLSGELPDCWDKLSELQVLSFSKNNFSGGIPSSICSHDSLEKLYLSKNGLTGELPSNLQNCTRLLSLDLGSNKLTGKIPSWVGENLSSLVFLSLRSNNLDGDIPHQLSQLTQLQILDLSHNALSGVIPRSYGNFSAMRVITNSNIGHFFDSDPYVFLNWNGKELDFFKNLEFLVSVDLSHNNLSGNIPSEIEDLIGLVSLNLSRNHLTGRIPDRIGNLTQLLSLDLSSNGLFGEIPRSMATLTFLGHLNLSYNSLSGSIPTGPQLQTLTDPLIYVGNLDLCGFPLPKCDEEPMPSISSIGRDEENEVDDDRLWIYIGIGPGFGVGIWVFSWIILFKKPWRDAYFHWIDNMCTILHLIN